MYMRDGLPYTETAVLTAMSILRYDGYIEDFATENDLVYTEGSEELIDYLISKDMLVAASQVYRDLYGGGLISAYHEVRNRKEKAEYESACEQAYQSLEKLVNRHIKDLRNQR